MSKRNNYCVFMLFSYSLQNICSDLTLFMDLFDSLSKLTKSSDENVPPVLDSDYKHSVLGKLAYVYLHLLYMYTMMHAYCSTCTQ